MNNNELILLKSGQDINNQNMNHIEFFCSNNSNITININKNYIILRGDSIYSLYYYFLKAIPINEIKNNLNKKEKHKFSNLAQLKLNFDYTKFLIPSTFNAQENLGFNIEKFVVLYNSVNRSKFPKGNFDIKLSSLSSIITFNDIKRKLFYSKNNFLSINLAFDRKILV